MGSANVRVPDTAFHATQESPPERNCACIVDVEAACCCESAAERGLSTRSLAVETLCYQLMTTSEPLRRSKEFEVPADEGRRWTSVGDLVHRAEADEAGN